MGPALTLLMNHALTTSLGTLAAGCFASAVRVGVWGVGGAASAGERQLVRYADVRVGAFAVGPVAGHSRPVHALCPSFHSSGRADARRLIQRWAADMETIWV